MKTQNITSKSSLSRKFIFYNYWKNRYLVLLFIPAILYYLLFHYGPLYGIQLAFKNYRVLEGIWASKWIGLQNFRDLFSLPSFFQVFGNTLIISIYKLIWGFPAPIIFAILLNEIRVKAFKKTVQTISYLPHFVSWVVLGGLFIQFLSPSIGPINIILKQLGFKPIYFLADVKWFRTVIVVTSIWKGVGWGSIVYIAALAGIDPTLYEAAIVDGASRIKRIIHVTLPSIVPVVTIMFIFAVGGIVNDDFDQIFNMYNPAVYKVGDVLSTYVYRSGIVEMKYSMATAAGLFKNVIAFSFIMISNAVAKRVNEYGIW